MSFTSWFDNNEIDHAARKEKVRSTLKEFSQQEAIGFIMSRYAGEVEDELDMMALSGVQKASGHRIWYARPEEHLEIIFSPELKKGLWVSSEPVRARGVIPEGAMEVLCDVLEHREK